MTGVTLYNGLPRSTATFVTVNNKLPYAFVQIILLQHGYCTFVIILFGPFHQVVHQSDGVHMSTFSPNREPLLVF